MKAFINKLIYGINTVIKCDIACKISISLAFLNWINEKIFFIVTLNYVVNINSDGWMDGYFI